MASASTKAGRGIAKALGINVDYRPDNESEAASATLTTETFIDKEPTAGEWLRELAPTGHGVKSYIKELFPFLTWIFHYNVTWLAGDLIAGKYPEIALCRLRVLTNHRPHSRSSCCSAGHGLRTFGKASP